MPEEAAALLARLTGPQPVPVPLAGATAESGHLSGTQTVVVTTGIGIAAATAAATWAILEHRPRAVVAAGSCGGLAADVEVGTLIVGDSFTWSLADATAFGYAPGQVPGGPERHRADPSWVERAERAARNADTAGVGHGVRRGLMLSRDAFVTASIAGPMRERFQGALSADMETAAYARTAAALGTPCAALVAVSVRCRPAARRLVHVVIGLVARCPAR